MVAEVPEIIVVSRVVHFIEHNIDGDLSTSAIASKFGFSERHLQRLFKNETGETLAGFIRRRRMEKAAQILAETGEPVLSVAERVGYAETVDDAVRGKSVA